MNDEFCPECGAKITGNTGFCSECGAITTSLQNSIEEAENAKIEAEKRKREEEKQKNEERIRSIKKNKYYIIGFLILVVGLIAAVIILPSLDTSDKVYDGGAYTVEYPSNYVLTKDKELTKEKHQLSMFEDKNSNGYLYIESSDSNLSAKEASEKISHIELNNGEERVLTDGGTTKVDGCEAYIVIDKAQDWTSVLFNKDGKLYNIRFKHASQEKEVMDQFLNSFKFK